MKIFLCGQKAFGAAVLKLCTDLGHQIAGVSAPQVSESGRPDRLYSHALAMGLNVMLAGQLNGDNLPAGVDLIIAAHSHDFIGRRTRAKARIGAIGYHPSLLPRHRGRDAVTWTIKYGDPVAGGTVYWLSDNVDAGDIAAQDWCWVLPGDTPGGLWRRELFPLGLRLFRQALVGLAAGRLVAIPQDERAATWEPSWGRPPLHRPDLLMIGDGRAGGRFEVIRERRPEGAFQAH